MGNHETKLPETLAPAQVVAKKLQEQGTEFRTVRHACVRRLRTDSLAHSASQSVGEYAQMPYASVPNLSSSQGRKPWIKPNVLPFQISRCINSDTEVPFRMMPMGIRNFLPSEESAFFHDSKLSFLITIWKLEYDQARTSCHLEIPMQ